VIAGAAPSPALDPRVARSRAAVLAATAELLGEVRFGGISVEAISARSGVARTTIYRHWPDAADLMADALAGVITPCPEPDTGTLRGDLTVILRELAATLVSSATAQVLPPMIFAAEADPAVAELQQSFSRQRRLVVRRALDRAAARGEIDAGFDFELVVSLSSGSLFYRRLVSREPLTEAYTDRVAAAVCALLGAP